MTLFPFPLRRTVSRFSYQSISTVFLLNPLETSDITNATGVMLAVSHDRTTNCTKNLSLEYRNPLAVPTTVLEIPKNLRSPSVGNYDALPYLSALLRPVVSV